MTRHSSNRRRVRCIETGEVYASIHEAAKAMKRSPGNLSRIVRYGMRDKYAGYHWEAIDPATSVTFMIVPNCGNTMKFESCQAIADYLAISLSNVRYHLKSHTPVKGVLIEKIEESEVF